VPTVVGIKLRFSPKTLHFDPSGVEVAEGDHAVVETERGTEIGEVLEAPHEVPEAELVAPLKPVLRRATDADLETLAEAERQEAEAMPVFRELIGKHGLDMKPVDVEYLFGGGKIIFYFSAEERVDFRELVRDLAARFKARIDMRQVGVRDEARMVGGIGHCGQMLCCCRFSGDFQPVSIRMAKEQDLPLNPLKISGLCGRLMCCLRYEYDAYKEFKSRAPKRGAMIETPAGDAKVVELNTPLEVATLRMPDGKNVRVPVGQMECKGDSRRPCKVCREALETAGASPAMLVTASESVAEDAGAQKTRRSESDGAQRGKRRPRRASPGAKTSGEAKPKQQDKQQDKKQQQAQGQQKAQGQQREQQGSGSSRRRRRRRRPSGGSGSGGQDAGQGSGQANTPT